MCLLRIRISQTANEEHLVTLVHGTATLTIHFLDQSMDQLIPKAVSEPPSVLGECSDSARTTSLRGRGTPCLVGNGAHARILPCKWGRGQMQNGHRASRTCHFPRNAQRGDNNDNKKPRQRYVRNTGMIDV